MTGSNAYPTHREAIEQLTSAGPFELTTDESSGYPIRIFRHAPPSLRAILQSSREYADLSYIIQDDDVLTYKAHYARVAALAHYLISIGVKKGDRIAIGMRNLPEWPVAFWACQAIGAVVVALNAWWTGAELQYALADSQPVALLVDAERLSRLSAHLESLDRHAVITAGPHAATGITTNLNEIFASNGVTEIPQADVAPNDFATILYTSGTTGKPKGAVATHRNHITNIMNSSLNAAARRVSVGFPLEAGPPSAETQPGTVQTFPFFHIAGLGGLMIAMVTGSKIALLYKWVPSEAVALIEKHQLTNVAGVPLVVRQLLEEAIRSGRSIDSLTYIGSGGAPVPPDLINRIGAQFAGKIMPGNGYGLTETTSGVIINTGSEYIANPDSVGRPNPTAEIRIIREDGEAALQGEIGELWVRGPNVIAGYWNDPVGTKAAFADGWFRTGDLGYVDTNGFYYVVDRKKDVIIRGGENVYCAEVEAELVAQPEVLDAAVLGLPHPEYGEEVAAVIQIATASNQSALTELVLARLENKLARFKIPTIIRFTKIELPRNAVGKVLKGELKSQYFGTEADKTAPKNIGPVRGGQSG